MDLWFCACWARRWSRWSRWLLLFSGRADDCSTETSASAHSRALDALVGRGPAADITIAAMVRTGMDWGSLVDPNSALLMSVDVCWSARILQGQILNLICTTECFPQGISIAGLSFHPKDEYLQSSDAPVDGWHPNGLLQSWTQSLHYWNTAVPSRCRLGCNCSTSGLLQKWQIEETGWWLCRMPN